MSDGPRLLETIQTIPEALAFWAEQRRMRPRCERSMGARYRIGSCCWPGPMSRPDCECWR